MPIANTLARLHNGFAHIILSLGDRQAGGDIVQHHLVIAGGGRFRAAQDVSGDLGEVLFDVGEENGIFLVRLDVAEFGAEVRDVDAVGGVFDVHGVLGAWWLAVAAGPGRGEGEGVGDGDGMLVGRR